MRLALNGVNLYFSFTVHDNSSQFKNIRESKINKQACKKRYEMKVKVEGRINNGKCLGTHRHTHGSNYLLKLLCGIITPRRTIFWKHVYRVSCGAPLRVCTLSVVQNDL